MKRISVLLVALFFVSCSAMKPSTQALKITCNVPDAIVKVNGDTVSVPSEVQVRRDTYGIKVEAYKEGYDRFEKTIYSHKSATHYLDAIGTAIFLVPAVGLMSPGSWDLDETEVNVILNKVN